MPNIDDAINSLSEEELDLLNSDTQLMSDFKNKYSGKTETPQTGIIQKSWNALGKPEQLSREGLTKLSGMVPNPEPTGNMAMDIMKGTPRVIGDTLAETAPGFVSRGSILTAGALKGYQAA